jgi:hypothetical protein
MSMNFLHLEDASFEPNALKVPRQGGSCTDGALIYGLTRTAP